MARWKIQAVAAWHRRKPIAPTRDPAPAISSQSLASRGVNMNKLKFAAALAVMTTAGTAQSAVYSFVGVVTLCTGTCNSFASLEIGTQVTGTWEINTTPSGSWSFADAGAFGASVFNPAAPALPFDGSNPTTANPLPLVSSIAPIAASGGGLTTGGTTDANNQLASGNILHEFVVPPFNSNGAWVIFDIGANGLAQAQVCLFFLTAGCIPNATQAVVIDGQFTRIPIPASLWMFGSALLGVARLRRIA